MSDIQADIVQYGYGDEWEEDDILTGAKLRHMTSNRPFKYLDAEKMSVRDRREQIHENRKLKRMKNSENFETFWLRVERAAMGDRSAASVKLPRNLREPWLSECPEAFSVQSITDKGIGLVATRDLEAGSTLLVAAPLSAYFEGEDEEEEEDDDDDDDEKVVEEEDPFLVDNATAHLVISLVLELLNEEETREKVAMLWPRELCELPKGPPKELCQWHCDSKQLTQELTSSLSKLAKTEKTLKITGKLAWRLPEIVRSNALAMDTSPELLCHPNTPEMGGMTRLSGVGLYHIPSFFNHDCNPNVARYHLGGLAIFRTNQPVSAGSELCISYLAHDLLGETVQVRRHALAEQRKNFTLQGGEEETKQSAQRPCVDVSVQQALTELTPADRLAEIDSILQEEGQLLLGVDCKELNVQKAVAHSQLGETSSALACWREVMDFVTENLPPNDESLPMVALQVAICLMAQGRSREAQTLIAYAVGVHDVAFGGGAYFMAMRYQTELLHAPLHKKAALRVWGTIAVMAGDRFRRVDLN